MYFDKTFDDLRKVIEQNDEVEKSSDIESTERIQIANEKAGVPLRFANSMIDDYERPINDTVRKFSLEPESDKIMLLVGPAGTGKSSLLTGTIHERAKAKMSSGLYFNIRELAISIRTSRSFKAFENELQFYRKFFTAPYLCLDEVGTCSDNALEREFLRTVIGARFDNKLRTAIATNLNKQMFYEFISNNFEKDPILDRIKSIALVIPVVGDSHRTA